MGSWHKEKLEYLAEIDLEAKVFDSALTALIGSPVDSIEESKRDAANKLRIVYMNFRDLNSRLLEEIHDLKVDGHQRRKN